MSHELTIRKNGKAEMAYAGIPTPWHGLGSKIDVGLPIEKWQEAAGMDFSIQRSVVRYNVAREYPYGTEKFREMPGQHVLFRSDTKDHLSVVSDKYKVVQPREVLEFFRDLTDANGFTLNTAGTLFGGRRFWALASIGEEACILGKEDAVRGNLLLSTSCDGTLPTIAQFTSICVVCNNALTMALKDTHHGRVSVRHRSVFDADAVKDDLGIARGHFGEFMKATRKLAKAKVTDEQAEVFLAELLRDSGTVLGKDVAKSNQFKTMMRLFKGDGMGAELSSRHQTLWGLVNSVTEFVDHHARVRDKINGDSQRLSSAWFGRGNDLKDLAMVRAVNMAS